MSTTLIVIIIVALVIGYAIWVYNRATELRNRHRNAFAQIDVQLQRRHDLIPNLVETARKYMEHERETLTRVTEARNEAMAARQQVTDNPTNSQAMGQMGQAENALTGSLANLKATAEEYPDLKANETMENLMEELSSTENRIGFARQAYNDAVLIYNTYRQQFPNNLVTNNIGSFFPAHPLELENPEARQAVQVQF